MKQALLAGVMALAGLMACSSSGSSSGGQFPASTSGAGIFQEQCAACHGIDGKLGMAGAKDLSKSALARPEMIAVVTQGKGAMIGFGQQLTDAQIEMVVDHVRTLHSAAGE